ncbi:MULTISPECIES: hypothetical protein [Proteus]|uniref:hypothetical protein n=1 Tax=Proteus TaxID=583 RepID=UPI001929F015|nr:MULTISPECIES: hypothetical protein [Proteus]NBM89241.1 hypothetical protein [Proteus sp. G2658]
MKVVISYGICPLFLGVTYEKLAGLAHIQWPYTDIEDMGTPYLYSGDQLTTPSCYITRFLINTQGKNKH